MSYSVPLSALREELPATPDHAYWQAEIDGIDGRALVQLTGAATRFGLRLGGTAELAGTVRLMRRDWRDGTAAVLATILATLSDGATRLLWSGLLESSSRLGDPGGLPFCASLPADTATLSLQLTRDGAPDPTSVARALWLDPRLTIEVDPSPADPFPVHPTDADPGDSAGPQPLISVLTPVHDPPVPMLEAAVDSLFAQTYGNWELQLVDDGSRDPAVIAALQRLAAADPRISLQRRERAQGISSATNAALAQAGGEYVALLDHDDTFTPDALERMVAELRRDPGLDMIYSDEALLFDNGEVQPIIKPGWSPEAMEALMYTCHLGMYRRDLAERVGAFDSGFDGCQDYDFVLRLMEHTNRVSHIPAVLYHWRAHANSTAAGDQAKPYAYVSQPVAIAAHLKRRGAEDAAVQFGPNPGMHRILHPLPAPTRVSFVLAVSDASGLAPAAGTWLAQPHANWSVALSAPESELDACRATLEAVGVQPGQIRLAPSPAGSATGALAGAAVVADGDILVFMEAPAAGLTHDWLGRLCGYAGQAGVAAVGPVALSADGRILHSGIVLPDGLPMYLLRGADAAAAPPAVANLSAVDGILATSAEWFARLGGVESALGTVALVDYCLRAAHAHGRSVLVPDVRMQMTEPPVINDLARGLELRARWMVTHQHEPFYNAAYRSDRGDFSLR